MHRPPIVLVAALPAFVYYHASNMLVFVHFNHLKLVVLLIGVLLPLFAAPPSMAGNFEKTYDFQTKYGLLNQKLYVSITPSLYNYYGNLTHLVNNNEAFANFVTSNAVAPIAATIRNVTDDLPDSDEQFANAVLSLVHEIPYNISNIEYPVETMVNNYGDCVSLSLLAASIMQAGGLDVVLILYTGINPSHMNVGVFLPYTPVFHSLLLAPTSFSYDNKSYWTAEATPEADWKVGDQSGALAGATVTIIPLNNNTAEFPPAQVAASLGSPLPASSININISENPLSNTGNLSDEDNYNRSLIISGFVVPAMQDAPVTIYVDNGYSQNFFPVSTDDLGGFSLIWNFTETGAYQFQASWSGNSNFTGSDSETLTLFVGPESVIQFQTPNYNYLLEPSNLSTYPFGDLDTAAYLSPMQGIADFLTLPLGTNVTLNCDFTVLQAGHTVSNVPATTASVSGGQVGVPSLPNGRNRISRPVTIQQLPNLTLTVPVSMPPNMEPLILPEDFNQTINDQFCFTLQKNGGNETLGFQALDAYSMANITGDSGSTTAFVNATNSVVEGAWYIIKASVSENGVLAGLYNGTTSAPISVGNNQTSTDLASLVMSLTNDVNNVVVFKDLKLQESDSATQLSVDVKKNSGTGGSFDSRFFLTVLLAATLTATIIYAVRKRRTEPEPCSCFSHDVPLVVVLPAFLY